MEEQKKDLNLKERKRRIRKKKRELFWISFVRFQVKYTIPIILFLLGIIVGIIIPYPFYYDGTMFHLFRAAISVIPMEIIFNIVIYRLVSLWLKLLRDERIIKI